MSGTTKASDIDDVISIIKDLLGHVDGRFDKVDDRFDKVDERFERVDKRFDKIEYEITKIQHEIVDLKESHNRLLNTVDGFIGRIDKYETELASRDSQFEKLLIWARKVSEKTGIPLENL